MWFFRCQSNFYLQKGGAQEPCDHSNTHLSAGIYSSHWWGSCYLHILAEKKKGTRPSAVFKALWRGRWSWRWTGSWTLMINKYHSLFSYRITCKACVHRNTNEDHILNTISKFWVVPYRTDWCQHLTHINLYFRNYVMERILVSLFSGSCLAGHCSSFLLNLLR